MPNWTLNATVRSPPRSLPLARASTPKRLLLLNTRPPSSAMKLQLTTPRVAGLHNDHFADQWPNGCASGRPRQYRVRQRLDRSCGRNSAGSHIRHLYLATRQSAGNHRSHAPRRTYFAYDQNNRIKLGEGRLALIHDQIDQGNGSLRLKAVIPAAASASVSRREMPFSSVCNRPVSAASGAVRSRFIVSLRVRFGRRTIAALTGGLAP